MKKQFLEAGEIVNTHGVRGEVKILPWANGADFLKGFKTLYIDEKPYGVASLRVHKGCAVAKLKGIDDMDAANALRSKIVFIDRDEAELDDGEYFLQDAIGLTAVDYETGKTLGKITEVIDLPSSDVYVIKGEREILVPVVDEFIKDVDFENEIMKIKLIEGM